MSEPPLRKYPAEIFGYPYSNLGQIAQKSRDEQHCPFLGGECKKPRKSEPHIKVGVCSVGYKGSQSGAYLPVIICPHRFELDVVKETIRGLYFASVPKSEKIAWASEVYLGRAIGSVDYVAVSMDEKSAGVRDFVGVELQAAGTTGTPWQAVQDHKNLERFPKDNYGFGINWANEFAKTMMQQAYKKGLIIEHWKKKIVFVIQDIGLKYLEGSYDTGGLREANASDAIHFCTFNMVWDEAQSAWKQRFERRVSTNTDGIRKILGGVHEGDFPTEDQFIDRIKMKLASS